MIAVVEREWKDGRAHARSCLSSSLPPPVVSLLDRPYELDVDKQPWPILLERTAAGLRDGQFEGVPESLDRVSANCRRRAPSGESVD